MAGTLVLPVAVSMSDSSDSGETIWRRKYRVLKRKCEELEQVGAKYNLYQPQRWCC